MTASGRFTHRNDGFICEYCQRSVPPLDVSCRNHCPFCLSSKHVDILPGDRANPCGGRLRAVSYEISSKKGLVLHFVCELCQAQTRNIAAHEAKTAPDDYDKILLLGRV